MEEVAKVWRGHFSAVLNYLNNERVDVASHNLAYDAEENCIVSVTEIERYIAKLKNGNNKPYSWFRRSCFIANDHLDFSCSFKVKDPVAYFFRKILYDGYIKLLLIILSS